MKLDEWKPKIDLMEQKRREAFGKEVRDIRQNNNLSVSDLANVLFISEDLVRRIERGKVSPNLPNVQQRLRKINESRKLVIS